MNDLTFEKPGSTYKKVKTLKLRLASKCGTLVFTEVTVYLYSGGTPHFAVKIPTEYVNVYKTKRDDHWLDRIRIEEGVLVTASFDQMEKDLQTVSRAYSEHIQNLNMEKVIVYHLAIKTPETVINAPSFSDSITHIVGLSAHVRYLVNGELYALPGHNSAQVAERVELPKWDDLHHMGRSSSKYIPFTPEAWASLCNVKAVLEKAGAALGQLKDAKDAQALLASGQFLLGDNSKKEAA